MGTYARPKLTAEEVGAIADDGERLAAELRCFLFTNATCDRVLSSATPEQRRFLDETLAFELAEREANRAQRLIRRARFPVLKSLEGYEWGHLSLPAALTRDELVSLAFMDRVENLVCLGPVGTGKTHLMVALGVRACERGREVRYFTVTSLIDQLSEARERGGLGALMKQLARADALLLDEFGYVPVDQTGARLLYQVVSEAYERQSLVITTNLDFSRWGSMLADDQLASAFIDRIAHHGHLLVFEGESYRLAHALMRR